MQISPVATALAASTIGVFAIGLFIYLASRDKQVARSFFVLSLLITSWIGSTFGIQLAQEDTLLLWTRLSHALVVPALIQLYLFLRLFSSDQKHAGSQRETLLHFILGLITVAVALSPYTISSAQLTTEHYTTSYGPGIYLFGGYAIWWLVSTTRQLYWRLRTTHATEREQLRLFLIGTLCTGIYALSSDLILPLFGYRSLVDTGPIATLFLCGVTGYAIVNERAIDLRLAIKRIIVLTAVLIFIAGVWSTSLWVSKATSVFADTRVYLVKDLLIAAIVAFSVQPLRRYVSTLVDAQLFKQSYDEQEVVRNLVVQLNGVIGLDEAIEIVMHCITRTLHAGHVVTYVFPQRGHENEQPVRIRHMGYEKTSDLPLNESDGVYEYFSRHPEAIELEHLKEAHRRTKIQPLVSKLEKIGAAIAIPLHIKRGELIGLICVSKKLSDYLYTKQDINLLNTIGEQAISSIQKARLYENDQAKNEFVSVASHELVTPISAIEGYLAYVMKPQQGEKAMRPQTLEYLQNVRSSIHRLSSQLKDLLDVSRIESGKMNMDFKEHDLIKLIQDTIGQLRFVATDKKISLDFEAPRESIPHIWADGDRTVQVLVNLISNAIKYNREKGSVTIAAGLLKSEGLVKVSVSDTGFGMNQDQMAHLFEKFYRVDSSKTVGIVGTGLGLYITKSIVERMGGTITVTSVEEKGTTFTFTIPVAGRANPILN